MTNDELLRYREMLATAINRGEVETKLVTDPEHLWQRCYQINAIDDRYVYRIKPQPRELYAIYDLATGVFLGAQTNPHFGPYVTTAKFREVLE